MANEQNLTPVKPGQVLNPNGRPKGSLNRTTIAKRFLEANSGSKDDEGNDLTYGELMTLTMIKKAIYDKDVMAHREVMDSGYGKITDKQEISGPDGSPIPTSLEVHFVEPKD